MRSSVQNVTESVWGEYELRLVLYPCKTSYNVRYKTITVMVLYSTMPAVHDAIVRVMRAGVVVKALQV